MLRNANCFIITISLILALTCAADDTNSQHVFSQMQKPEGWSVPKPGKQVRVDSELAKQYSAQGIEIAEYESPKTLVKLPWYYSDDGILTLNTYRFRVVRLIKLACEGRQFGWLMELKGVGMGMGGTVAILDNQGDGVLRRLEWNPRSIEIPAWARKTP